MPPAKDRTGQRFGKLVAVRDVGDDGKGRLWLCRCDCGNEVVVRSNRLPSRGSCTIACAKTTHGGAYDGTYRSWAAMRHRCKSDEHSKWYKNRGIRICRRWMKFENFLADMGERPDGMTLERKDGDRGYEPGNCRWETWSEQARNKSNSILIEYRGITLIPREWACVIGITEGTFRRHTLNDGRDVGFILERFGVPEIAIEVLGG